MKVSFYLLLLQLLFICPSFANTSYYFQYSPLAKNAYQDVLTFRFKDAQRKLNQLKLENPNNLIVHHIESYIDLFKVYIGAEDYSLKAFKDKKTTRLKEIKKGNTESPYYFYVEAEVRLHAALARWKYGEHFGAFQDIVKAYRLLEKNQKKFPYFVGNQKDLGILHAFIGTIPNGYQWGLKLFTGLEGSIEQGLNELETVVQKTTNGNYLFRKEALIMQALLTLHLQNDKNQTWEILDSMALDTENNMFYCYVIADVAMQTGKNDLAIQVLENRPTGKDYYPFHYLDYLHGVAKLRKLDQEGVPLLQRFINNFKGDFHIKSAYQKLAWFALLRNDLPEYKKQIQLVRENGASENGADENAQNEAIRGKTPIKSLLKARLLFDGGYYKKAQALLNEINATTFKEKQYQVEYFYRLGRITHSMGQFNNAIENYKLTILHGRQLPDYFACNAALQLGVIYESIASEKAKEYFELCLKIDPSEYRNSLHQKAKSGLNRIKNKSKN